MTEILTTDKLAEFREAAKAGQPVKKMTERAATALRALGEHDKRDKAADARLVEQFNSKPKTVEVVMDTLYAISRDAKDIRKRAIKCFYMLSRGLKVYSIHDVSFLGSLLPEEEAMSLSKIITRYPVDESEIIEPVKPDAAPQRLCALGSKCLRSYKRKAAVVTGKGLFCSSVCKGAAVAAKRRLRTVDRMADSPVLAEFASQTRINSGLAGGIQ